MAEQSVRFDRAAGFYDATRGFPPGVGSRVAALVAEGGELGPGSRVLEIGVGTGRIARPLAPLVAEVVGVDLSRPMLERLRAQRGDAAIHVALGDATALPLADASVDAALAVHVFHLIPGWRAVLSELARVLRPGAPLLSAGDEVNPLFASVLREFFTSAEPSPGMRDLGVPRDRIPGFLEDEGWRRRGPRRAIEYRFRTTPRRVIELLEARSPSNTWRLDDAELADLVERARRFALERVGDLDRELDLSREFEVLAYLPPG